MSNTRFVQIHFLTQYPASLLNRDDVGLAKRIPFGGTTRTRVSSQCLKRHWRTAQDDWALENLDAGMSTRSRYIFAQRIAPALLAEGLDASLVVSVLQSIKAELLGESKKTKQAKGKKGAEDPSDDLDLREELKTEQVIVLGQAEVDYIIRAAKEICAAAGDVSGVDTAVKEWFTKEARANLKNLERAAGLDGALFGRMVTSDVLARGDAAVHVAHAFTVHREYSETDYFSAIDDLEKEDGALGSGHIGNTELTSGLFYGYVVIDIPLLVSNLGGDQDLAQKTIEHFIHLVATVSPGAKLGSTAPYARASLIMVEKGSTQPRSLSDAFLKAITVNANESIAEKSIASLSQHLSNIDRMYGSKEERAFASYYDSVEITNADNLESLDELATWGSAININTTMVSA